MIDGSKPPVLRDARQITLVGANGAGKTRFMKALMERLPGRAYYLSALSASFGLQGIINMASTLHLMPTKGMTLPFISYGGSSLLATALGMGMLLAITRKNVHAEDKDVGD